MGNSYYVPRSVKGESRLLNVFTIKSFAATLAFGLIGFALASLIGSFVAMATLPRIIITAVFAGIGYVLATLKIPDVPAMGPLRKAGGENIGSMILRAMTFGRKKKIYLYNYKRTVNRGGDSNGK